MNCIVIKTASAVLKTIRRDGKPTLHFNEQTAALECGEDFPRPFKITLQEGQQPYAPGRYSLDVASLTVGKYDALEMGRDIRLVPLAATAAAPVAAVK